MREAIEALQALRGILNDFKGPIEFLLYGLGFWAFCALLHVDIKQLPKKLLAEFRQLAKLQFTVAGMDAFIVVLLLVLAAFIVASNELKALFGFVVSIVGRGKATELVEHSYFPMFFTLALSAVFSVWAVARVETEARKKKPTRRSPGRR